MLKTRGKSITCADLNRPAVPPCDDCGTLDGLATAPGRSPRRTVGTRFGEPGKVFCHGCYQRRDQRQRYRDRRAARGAPVKTRGGNEFIVSNAELATRLAALRTADEPEPPRPFHAPPSFVPPAAKTWGAEDTQKIVREHRQRERDRRKLLAAGAVRLAEGTQEGSHGVPEAPVVSGGVPERQGPTRASRAFLHPVEFGWAK